MDEASVDKLREQLAMLFDNAEALMGATRDFPALACNLARVKASLKMVAIDLGLIIVDPQGDF